MNPESEAQIAVWARLQLARSFIFDCTMPQATDGTIWHFGSQGPVTTDFNECALRAAAIRRC